MSDSDSLEERPAGQPNATIQGTLDAFTEYINTSTLLDLAYRFSATYSRLARESTEHFLVTPVTALPTGKEKGKFLSIDVGGTNLRVGFIELVGDLEQYELGNRQNGQNGANEESKENEENVFAKVKRSHDKNWPIGDHLKMDQAEDLFAWIGSCIAKVVRDAMNDTPASVFADEILLGITFSFPMAQTRLSEATLLPMGKGFAITSDLNLGKMLLAGYERHRKTLNSGSQYSELPRIRVAAITNDTVATFASLAYAVKAAPKSRVAMGLIVGTGTNATVPMKLGALHPSKRAALPDPDAVSTVVINTEWTIRGTDQPLIDLGIKTGWDQILDQSSDAPGFQPFEYMTAGRYLGEIVRLVLNSLFQEEQAGGIPAELRVRNALPTRFLSEVVARLTIDQIAEHLERKFPSATPSESFWTRERAQLICRVAEAVQRRSSALIAAACVGLLHCVGEVYLKQPMNTNGNGTSGDIEELVIAYAGGTISQYPEWLETCQYWIDEIVKHGSPGNAGKRVVLKEALDGGIIGAGVLAGMEGEIH